MMQQAMAQTLTESEVTATMYRAFELNKAKKYAEENNLCINEKLRNQNINQIITA